MEDEDGYMALDRRCERGAAERPGPLRDAGPAMKDPEMGFAPRWIHIPTRSPRCLLGALMTVLVLSFVICVSWLLVERQRPPGAVGCRNASQGQSFATLDCTHLGLRTSLCPPGDGGGCKLCPVGWTLHGSKCFWVASKSSSWRESRENCSRQSAQLLVPEDQGELDFLNRVIQKPTRYFWIGLSQPSVGMGWTWLDGSRLDRSRFNLSTLNASGACGALREDRIISETCGSALAWICQKEAVLL
ncbi:killer cell lectin-like receptor subfamily B member 1B allele B [Cygnus atratus]|uniref:killer cell lectin-like receptor subfamily B member 1B allele B n=1 Tax=Cygnus atratus TaxID=8868 RepID=UPI0021B7D9A6|nr:killer cell lectin-like receptor subfamily B member 1B allele B [Cygnus atratus]